MTQQATREQAQWQGSENTAKVVYRQILERWGEEEASKYDPQENCFTFNAWRAKGYIVKKGEKALRSYTFIKGQEVAQNGDHAELMTTGSYPKGVCLFYYLQVEKKAAK